MFREITVIIAVALALFVLNLLWLSLYCRIEEKVDSIKKKNSGKRIERNVVSAENGSFCFKDCLKAFYKWLDPYLYGWMRYSMLQIGKLPSNRIRKILFKNVFCLRLSKGTVISAGCEIRSPWNVQLGKCTIAGNCILDGRSGIVIEDNVVLGMGVHIWTQEHDVNSASFAVDAAHCGTVIIHNRAWICSDSTVLPGIEIGEGAVVAARACVTKHCEPFMIYGGVPAKKIGERNHNLTYELSGKPHWHFN